MYYTISTFTSLLTFHTSYPSPFSPPALRTALPHSRITFRSSLVAQRSLAEPKCFARILSPLLHGSLTHPTPPTITQGARKHDPLRSSTPSKNGVGATPSPWLGRAHLQRNTAHHRGLRFCSCRGAREEGGQTTTTTTPTTPTVTRAHKSLFVAASPFPRQAACGHHAGV